MLKVITFACTFYLLYCCSIFLDASVKADDVSCDKFFSGEKWPLPYKSDSLVKLCQTQKNDNNVYYATLFDTARKIPLYSANKVILNAQTNNKN